MEEWRDIFGYKGRYQVSDWGRVKSLARSIGTRTVSEKIMSQQKFFSSHGTTYMVIWLRCPPLKRRKFFVHILVANAFLPNPFNLDMVNHRDNDGYHNHVSNLEWSSYSDNSKHYYAGRARAENEVF